MKECRALKSQAAERTGRMGRHPRWAAVVEGVRAAPCGGGGSRDSAPTCTSPHVLPGSSPSYLPRGLSGLVSHGFKSLKCFESVSRSVEGEHSQRHSNMKHLAAAYFMSGTKEVSGEIEVSKTWFLGSWSPPSFPDTVKIVNQNCVQNATGI